MLFVANEAVPIFTLPKRAAATQEFVDSSRAERLPTVDDRGKVVRFHHLRHEVHVVGHDMTQA